jgi:hypothetical protein
VAYWKSRLAELGPGLCVGISWRSGNMKGNRPLYCTSIEQWQPIFSIPGIHFVNLQYDECADELNYAREHFFVDIHAFSEVDLYNDLDEAAALTSALDLVISAPTTAAILSAALGVMTWEIMRGLEWQYFGTDKNCFYSNLQVFHKKIGDEWDATINDVAVQLKQVVNAKLVAQQ